MGSGIAQVCAQSGYQVVVTDIDDALLKKGLATIDYYVNRGVEKGKISQRDKGDTLAHIKGTSTIRDFNDCDLVIEVVPEDMELKKRVFAELDRVCPKHTILTSNTNSPDGLQWP